MSTIGEQAERTAYPVVAAHYPRDRAVDAICDLLAQGMSLVSICRKPQMPSLATVMNWQRSNPVIAHELWEARALGCNAIAEECLRIADEATPADIQVARLRVATRLRLLAAWAPQQYGRAVTGENGTVNVVIDMGAMGVKPPGEVIEGIALPSDDQGAG